jgi:DNA-binding PadR family transcriptional regulator
MRLRHEAYGVSIKNKIKDLINRDWNYGTLYGTLDQLVKKGLLEKKEGKPMPERGGRRKIYYTVSAAGKTALQESFNAQAALWEGLSPLIFGKDV